MDQSLAKLYELNIIKEVNSDFISNCRSGCRSRGKQPGKELWQRAGFAANAVTQ
jgi:hypothetical protein